MDFRICEWVVKSLLRDYFLQFSPAVINKWCAMHRIRPLVIPKKHKELGAMYERAAVLPGVNPESLANLGTPAKKMLIENGKGEVYGLYLTYTDNSPIWDEALVNSFGDLAERLRATVGQLLSSADLYLKVLHQTHPELPDLRFDLEKSTMMWVVHDPVLKLPFLGKIGCRLELLSPEEVDKIQEGDAVIIK